METPPMKSPRNCSQCGNNGHNARTCITESVAGIMLFGVRLTATETSSPPSTLLSSAFRKTVSMNNLSQYEHQPHDSPGADGYASDDALHVSVGRRSERKRGIPWTEEEHKLFLIGLKKVGKGDWRGISRNFVKTRTPTQVASHAQKYFLRRNNVSRRRRRTSLFDITTDAVTNSSIEEEPINQDSASPSLLTSAVTQEQEGTNPIIPTLFLNPKQTCPISPSSKMANLNLNQSPSSFQSREIELEPFLSLKLSSAPSDDELVSRGSVFGEFNSSGDSIISVA